jgi:hypothetical protein
LYINRLSLSHTNKEKNDIWLLNAATFYFPIRISEYDSLFMGNKKDEFVYIFISLSFVYFIIVHKKPTFLISVKIGTDSSNYGKIDTFESTY